jgi:hypothetical protein
MLEYKRKLPHFHPDDVYILLDWASLEIAAQLLHSWLLNKAFPPKSARAIYVGLGA